MIRRTAVFFVVLGLALSVWTVPAAARPEIHRLNFKGLYASAAFSSLDEAGCVATDVFVGAMDGNVKIDGQPDATSEAFVDLSQFDICTGEQLLAASGNTVLPPEEFVIDPELSQAELNTTLVVDDFVSGQTFRLEVSITWSGSGEAATQKAISSFKSPDGRIFSYFIGTLVDAAASGTVTGMESNFTPEPSVFGQLANVINGEVDIIHGP
jgi:hypothetical protein